ncbi:uncharacterized protein [Physcomitrium patens]|uniref:uncharacterized protein n=1 Tax=Physcomitrium patens TaxID=3218 RepID=UPI003CCD408D
MTGHVAQWNSPRGLHGACVRRCVEDRACLLYVACSSFQSSLLPSHPLPSRVPISSFSQLPRNSSVSKLACLLGISGAYRLSLTQHPYQQFQGHSLSVCQEWKCAGKRWKIQLHFRHAIAQA